MNVSSHAAVLAAFAAVVPALAACAFEDTKPEVADPDASVVVAPAPLAGRWCVPSALDGDWTLDASGGAGSLAVDGRELAARWTFDAAAIVVERRLDGVLFERQRWELGADAALVRRVVETPDVLSAADEALVMAHPLDGLQALRDVATWDHALAVAGAACDLLPSAYGHGYPAAEGWYVAGSADVAAVAPGVGWYGHGGDAAGAPFAPARSRVITITYDGDERMSEERLDRGASDGGPHDLLRERTFDADGRLVTDRIERWSPTPKEDIVRVMSFAAEGAALVRRELADTWGAPLDVRWIPRPW